MAGRPAPSHLAQSQSTHTLLTEPTPPPPAAKRSRVERSSPVRPVSPAPRPATAPTHPPPRVAGYGRHTVSSIERLFSELRLTLEPALPTPGGEAVPVLARLAGSWVHTPVNPGDVVHVLASAVAPAQAEQADQVEYLINDRAGLCVVNPDHLVSGTSVVSTLFCPRQAVLNERFKGLSGSSKTMFIGTLVHELLQICLARQAQTRAAIDEQLRLVLQSPAILRDMLLLSMTLYEVRQEVELFLPHILYFTEKYVLGRVVSPPEPAFAHTQSTTRAPPKPEIWPGQVDRVCDIEENVWSPRLGMKGKIDLTVQVKLHHRDRQGRDRKVMPLELKTGRASGSAEHRGQVIMYSMMMAERRPDPEAGLLLYLRNSSVQEVRAGVHEMRGLVQLRNELASHLKNGPSESGELPPLPEPINLKRACGQCPHLMACTLHQKLNDTVPPAPHAMAELVPQTLSHLQEDDLQFFKKWSLMCAMEAEESGKGSKLKELWCRTPTERQAQNTAIAQLRLVPKKVSSDNLHTFVKSNGPLPPVFQLGETVILSSETELALSQGIITTLDEDQLSLALDRDLMKQDDSIDKVYHLDRYEYQGSMASSRVNLVKLMSNLPRAAELRDLIIRQTRVNFAKGLPKDILDVAKPILKSLNRVQQKAVFKLLMAEKFVALKGMPGTGKTTLIVALVRMMLALGKSVLLTSYTHSAVDNILLKLKTHTHCFLRLGRYSRIHPDIQPFSVEKISQTLPDLDSLDQKYSQTPVVATTCLGLNHPAIVNRTFDFCIVDEAAQSQFLAALGPLFYCHKFILVGDPDQLPPVVQSGSARSLGMDVSLFAMLEHESNVVPLSIQYRMNQELMNCANHLTYNKQLTCGSDEIANRTIDVPTENVGQNAPLWIARCLCSKLEHSIVFVDTKNVQFDEEVNRQGVRNIKEAHLVRVLVQRLKGLNHSVGVIAPYRSQVDLLRQLLVKTADVNTVDQFQGQDKDIIVYSCTRTRVTTNHPDLNAKNENTGREILDDARRLNVAMTRAKCKFIMIGSRAALHRYKPFQDFLCYLQETQIIQLEAIDVQNIDT
eukprot:TCALIF_09226-PA protein Name:"Similar to Dna2 DNA replication ATP-dependent helicase/nuclease DNA2 (Mus musculus)" AED:0.03 eAED:0.03 QI:0/0.66/0.5/0.75/1/1/4/36/1063